MRQAQSMRPKSPNMFAILVPQRWIYGILTQVVFAKVKGMLGFAADIDLR